MQQAQAVSSFNPTGFLTVLPAVTRHTQIQFRHVRGQDHDDAVQEAVAQAYLSWAGLAEQGREVKPSAIAHFAALRVKSGARVGGHVNTKDVMNPLAQQRRGFRVVSMSQDREPGLPNPDDALANPVSISGLIPDERSSVLDQVAFKMDFQAWCQRQPERDQAMMAMLAAGHGPSHVADQFGLSRPRMSQLRAKWAKDWALFQEPDAKADQSPAQAEQAA